MQIIARADLVAVLTGPVLDPVQEFTEDQTAIANAILAFSAAPFFVYTDSENGEDVQVAFNDVFGESRHGITTTEVLPLAYNSRGMYYGLIAQQLSWEVGNSDTPRTLFQAYLAGSPLQSAAGYVICAAWPLS